MFQRNILRGLNDALQDTPVILINGSRQVGKSTFVKSCLKETHQYLTLDDPTILSAIQKDPVMFLEGLGGPIIIDEVQRAPNLFLPLKKNVDDFRRPGYFVLTGSANVLALPRMGDSLVGRMEIHTLWPLSRGEIMGKEEDFISYIFSDTVPTSVSNTPPKISLEELIDWLCRGGYPLSIIRESHSRRQKWFDSYIKLILEKDIRELSNIEALADLPNLLQLLAARCGNLLNTSEISRSLGIPHTTLKRYLSLLENVYLLITLPAWSKSIGKRLSKSPKIFLNDTGLLLHLVGYNKERLLKDRPFLGHVFENYVVMELQKQMTWSHQSCRMYHYRTHSDREVDIVLEAPDSRVVGIEIKLANSVGPQDFVGISDLEEDLKDRFHRGIVLYLGDTIVPFGRNKHAIPLGYLWHF